ncbi:MAG: argininosuccinate synthetase [Alectoria sarmentosa]|nr:MAG: argininosuccinate synthetase [Alectoria sarmentosa]
MSGKLDQSLDEILSTRRKTAGRRGRAGRRVGNGTKAATATPAGGIHKNTRGAKTAPAKGAVPSGPAAGSGESKIIVGNLPSDVNEFQIKEYFGKSVGHVKKAMLTYGPNGVSRGIATIVFSKSGSASDALIQLNGMLVDKRPMKIEVVLDASKAVAVPAKGLGDRVTQGKNQPKSAAAKPATNGTATRGGRAGGRGARRGRNVGRPKAKTADELDAEMVDYFDANAANGTSATTDAAGTVNGAAAPATNGEEIGMDEISAWLIEQNYEVVCFCADVGQEEDFEKAREKALKIGAKSVYIEDLRKEFIEEQCFTAIQCNAVYESVYLLGTSLARPVIARAQIEIAKREGCIAVSHGCTGKGNDTERFAGRQALLDYAAEKSIPVTSTKSKPWSMDENLAHCSFEAGILENPDTTWKLTVDPLKAPDEPTDFTLEFTKGIPTRLEFHENGEKKTVTDSVLLFLTTNAIAKRNGVGRIDILENRFVGLKSRGCYETPGLTCLRSAHIDLEGLTLDREVRALRDQFVTFNYSRILYKTEKLYDENESSMDEIGDFAPSETGGFIGVQAIRLKKYGSMKLDAGEKM